LQGGDLVLEGFDLAAVVLFLSIEFTFQAMEFRLKLIDGSRIGGG
jgi:hypothetical protein